MKNALPGIIFRTIPVALPLSCRNTPNQKVNFSSICRSVLVFTGKAPVFCLAAVHIMPWKASLGELTVDIALTYSSAPFLNVPASRFLIAEKRRELQECKISLSIALSSSNRRGAELGEVCFIKQSSKWRTTLWVSNSMKNPRKKHIQKDAGFKQLVCSPSQNITTEAFTAPSTDLQDDSEEETR